MLSPCRTAPTGAPSHPADKHRQAGTPRGEEWPGKRHCCCLVSARPRCMEISSAARAAAVPLPAAPCLGMRGAGRTHRLQHTRRGRREGAQEKQPSPAVCQVTRQSQSWPSTTGRQFPRLGDNVATKQRGTIQKRDPRNGMSGSKPEGAVRERALPPSAASHLGFRLVVPMGGWHSHPLQDRQGPRQTDRHPGVPLAARH